MVQYRSYSYNQKKYYLFFYTFCRKINIDSPLITDHLHTEIRTFIYDPVKYQESTICTTSSSYWVAFSHSSPTLSTFHLNIFSKNWVWKHVILKMLYLSYTTQSAILMPTENNERFPVIIILRLPTTLMLFQHTVTINGSKVRWKSNWMTITLTSPNIRSDSHFTT